MKNSYAFALVIALAAAPAAAQPKGPSTDAVRPLGPGPIDPGPLGPGPLGVGPFGPGPIGLGPIGPGPLGPGPIGEGPQGLGPDQDALSPLFKLVQPPVIDEAFLEEAKRLAEEGKFVVDKMLLKDMKDMKLFMPKIDMAAIEEAKRLAIDARFFAENMALGMGHEQGRDEERRDREAEMRAREAEMRAREKEREYELYNRGYEAALDYKWDQAVSAFNRVIDMKGPKADAALYWKAYSQNKLGQRAEALATIADLNKNYPTSSYRKQLNPLEAEVRRDMGQPVRPQDSTDDEVKLMALQALANSAPDETIPSIEKLLEGSSTPRVKQRALYVLAQSRSPRAREVLRNYAKGSSTPELQSQAIRYLGVQGGPENRAILAEVYSSTNDVDVKRMILRSFMTSGDKERLFKAAQGEQNPELRMEAVRQLGSMSAHDELWQLYQKESSVDVKRRILQSMQAGGSVERLIELAKGEKTPELRRDAVRYLGNMRSTRTGDVLVQIYNSESNVDIKKSVINGLFTQDNATALVALARKEQDVNLKKEIVSRLANMHSKIATDYMIELLGK